MKISGEIIIIEDDQDDRDFLKEIFESLNYPNKIVFFEDPTKVVDYLSDETVNPFLIISDINMPKLNGYELRNEILNNSDINKKCVPYIFLSTSQNPENVIKAYEFPIQGYFKKQENFSEYKEMINKIMQCWFTSLSPVFR
ncbi:CheY-like chemotaxis protein [Flavobacterium sp. HSC-32F16]|uniref:response regulator n=1 Tax=Flavobacterium sp. HSC-32F16 TaxID=2910964 RepID=UPI0020A4266A|nr:response regulator [Flavobacterium sp. HSC-32F16]MCP2025812.1 CheY-like chemotaxis protein [Flavobacterium sp. HSC-32F16]